MSIIDTLVTTRGAGTYYNAADLNRVEGAVSYIEAQFNALPGTLAAYLASFGIAPDSIFEVPYDPISLAVKTDWSGTDIPHASDMERYIDNINTLRAAIALPDSTPEPPDSMSALTWSGANNIEIVLQAIDAATLALEALKKSYADSAALAWRYCGTFNCGQGVILP